MKFKFDRKKSFASQFSCLFEQTNRSRRECCHSDFLFFTPFFHSIHSLLIQLSKDKQRLLQDILPYPSRPSLVEKSQQQHIMSSSILTRGFLAAKIAKPTILSPVSARSICHKDHIDPEIKASKPKPWPYDRKKFTHLHSGILRVDRTVDRFDENTKVILIEGPIACGKSAFGIELADKLGMRYYGQPEDEIIFKRGDRDWRLVNWKLPELAQVVDMKMFHLNPHHANSAALQFYMYHLRYFHYMEGLTHLFNTGQGVIHNRSVYSDKVFFKALMKMKIGRFNMDSWTHYNDIRRETLTDLLRPHLVIYLDVPPEQCVENIKKRGILHEVNSPVNTVEYMKNIEEVYKEEILPELSKHAEILVYDWKEGGDMDLVIEDLEGLDFDPYEGRTQKTEDWRFFRDTDFDDLRKVFTHHRYHFYKYFFQPDYDHPSVQMDQETAEIRQMVRDHYNQSYLDGWDPSKHSMWQNLTMKNGHWRDKWELIYFGQSLRGKWTQLTCV